MKRLGQYDHLTRTELAAAHLGLGSDLTDPAILKLIEAGLPPIAGGAVGNAALQDARPGLRPAVRRTGQHDPAGAGVEVVPFTSAAHERTEGAFVDVSFTPGAAEVDLAGSPFQVPAYGYIRHVWLLVTGSGGTLGAGVVSADFPWNVLSSVQFTDVNGAPIVNPLDGYALMQANIFSGAAGGVNDPRVIPLFVGTINFAFAIRVPLEISHRSALGALANQNSAANYRLGIKGNTSGNVFSTAPTTVPAVRVRAFAEEWTVPNEVDQLGRPQAQIPPRLGTAQYISQYLADVAAGANTVRLTKTGNLVRFLLIIARTTAAGAPRTDGVFMDPLDFQWDGRNIHSGVTQNYITSVEMREKLPDLSARDTGVFAFPFNNSDHNMIGDDDPTFWWPTVQSSRLELRGNSATAGRLQLITGDVAPAELSPEERYELTSETGFTPEVGVPVRQG